MGSFTVTVSEIQCVKIYHIMLHTSSFLLFHVKKLVC